MLIDEKASFDVITGDYLTTEVITPNYEVLSFQLKGSYHFTWLELFLLDGLYRLVDPSSLSLYLPGRITTSC